MIFLSDKQKQNTFFVGFGTKSKSAAQYHSFFAKKKRLKKIQISQLGQRSCSSTLSIQGDSVMEAGMRQLR